MALKKVRNSTNIKVWESKNRKYQVVWEHDTNTLLYIVEVLEFEKGDFSNSGYKEIFNKEFVSNAKAKKELNKQLKRFKNY